MRKLSTNELRSIVAGKTFKCSCGYTTKKDLAAAFHWGTHVPWKHYPV